MKNILNIILKTSVLSIPFWIVTYLSFSIYNKTFKTFLWDDIQRGNFIGLIIMIYFFSFVTIIFTNIDKP